MEHRAQAEAQRVSGGSLDPRLLGAAVVRGDPVAEAEFVRRHYDRLAAFFRKWVSQATAEDLCQDAFLVVLSRLREGGGVQEAERLDGFLWGTARRLLLAHRRAAKRVPVDFVDMDQFRDDESSPIDDLARCHIRRLVGKAIGQLASRRDRQVLVHRYLLESDSVEIRRCLELNQSSYKVALHRARRRLRHLLQNKAR